MKTRKRIVATQTTLNLIDEKKADLAFLQGQSDDAISIFTNAIQRIKTVNAQIATKRNEIASMVQDLLETDGNMLTTQLANENLVKKFEGLLSVE